MLYIISSPRVYSTLQAEIDDAVETNKISRPIVQNEEARTLSYLQAVIKEGLRTWPPGTGLMAKLVPPEGDTLNGVFLPGGTKIGVNMWALLRDPEVFGEDATVFRPERWLEASSEEYAKMEKVHELVWGYGRYVCLGRSVALLELNKVLVEVSQMIVFLLYLVHLAELVIASFQFRLDAGGSHQSMQKRLLWSICYVRYVGNSNGEAHQSLKTESSTECLGASTEVCYRSTQSSTALRNLFHCSGKS